MKFLLTFHKLVRKATDGMRISRSMTTVNRLVLICLVLGLGGASIFAYAIRTAPAGVWLTVSLGLGLRVVLWVRRKRP